MKYGYMIQRVIELMCMNKIFENYIKNILCCKINILSTERCYPLSSQDN